MADHQDVYLRLYLSAFKNGLVADMGANNFMTLLAIASFMDQEGRAFPTQQQIADRLGVHLNTVNRSINSLLKFQINGKPVLTREKVRQVGGCFSSLYTIQPSAQVAIFDGKVERIDHQKGERIHQNEGRTVHQNGDVTITSINNNQYKQEPNIWNLTEEDRMLRLLERLGG